MLRRNFLIGLAAAVAAPAIIRPGILMPVKAMLPDDGVALFSACHPITPGWQNECRDILESSFDIVEIPASKLVLARPGLRIAGIAVGRSGEYFPGDVVAYR